MIWLLYILFQLFLIINARISNYLPQYKNVRIYLLFKFLKCFYCSAHQQHSFTIPFLLTIAFLILSGGHKQQSEIASVSYNPKMLIQCSI